MISQVNASVVGNAYAKSLGESKESSKASTNISKQGDTGKIEQIKVAIESGEYRINLQALSQKIAEELL